MANNTAYNLNLKENTLKMYSRTIEEMSRRGATEEEIKIVEDARDETLAAYDDVQTDENAIKRTHVFTPLIARIKQDFPIILSNMFIVKLGKIASYLCQALYLDVQKKFITVRMYETVDFSPYRYFTENKKFEQMTIEYIYSTGVVQRHDEVRKLKVKEIHMAPLSYRSEKAWTTEITFKYKEYVPTAD